MSTNNIYALAQRHASIERKIEQALNAPKPDTLYIMELKKLRLIYRDRIRAAIREKRYRAVRSGARQWTAKTARSAMRPNTSQPLEGH